MIDHESGTEVMPFYLGLVALGRQVALQLRDAQLPWIDTVSPTPLESPPHYPSLEDTGPTSTSGDKSQGSSKAPLPLICHRRDA
jgi:hypothetical protein